MKDRAKIQQDYLEQLNSDAESGEKSEALEAAIKALVNSYCRDDADITIIKSINLSVEKSVKKQ